MLDRIEVGAMHLSWSGKIIVTAKDECTADDLIAYRDKRMSSVVKGYRKDKNWANVIAHGVPTYAFGQDMEVLHQEITNFNNNI